VKQFELSIDREIKYMIKYQLTADELFVLRLIFYAQEGHGEYISTFFSECQLGSSLRSILNSLQAKGIINKSYSIPEEGTVFKADDVDLNKNAVNQFLQHLIILQIKLVLHYSMYNICCCELLYHNYCSSNDQLCPKTDTHSHPSKESVCG
jgi:hypothetical protein